MPAVLRAVGRIGCRRGQDPRHPGRRRLEDHRPEGGTSGAHHCKRGLATVRTDFDVPKHAGITMVILDMEAPGVEVRRCARSPAAWSSTRCSSTTCSSPTRTWSASRTPGWTVARATLGNERVSIGGGAGGIAPASAWLVDLVKRNGDHVIGATAGRPLPGRGPCAAAVGTCAASCAPRGRWPGPEGNITKLKPPSTLG